MSTATELQRSKAVETAKAVRITTGFAIEQLSFDSLPVARPGVGQVLVKIRAVSLNFRDLLIVTGNYRPNLPRPLVIASDGAGEVIAAGDGVTQFKPGDRVAGSFFKSGSTGGSIERLSTPLSVGQSMGC